MTLVACVVGTRPEAIKLAPVIRELRRRSWCRVTVIATAQHRHLLDQVLGLFGIEVDLDLDIMQPNQSLSTLTARLFEGLAKAYTELAPDAVLAQGDTTTVFAAATVAHYNSIWFGHVEAGLRSGRIREPFPEEFNRRAVALISDVHFAPTAGARNALLREGVEPGRVELTGNTVIDALLEARNWPTTLPLPIAPDRRVILLTVHRRENFGAPLQGIFAAVRQLVRDFPDVEAIYPVHPNPNVAEPARSMLGSTDRVHLVEPLPYDQLVAAMVRSHLILTDSGGIQEEAPALAKPVLVLRRTTERPEAITTGAAELVGTEQRAVVDAASRLLRDPQAYASMCRGGSPYGDGLAARRIVDSLERRFQPKLWRNESACPPLADVPVRVARVA
jgi:UDP-N-acetylglucosamine 2-epimerase (non-hydrolysing)